MKSSSRSHVPFLNNSLRAAIGLLSVVFLLILFVPGSGTAVAQQTISFSSSGLQGVNLNNPTSLQFGPDGRLYVSQQNGVIYAYAIQRNAANDYQVTATETIDLIKFDTPNHNDDGATNSTTNRQVTGIVVSGTGTNPVLYVSSSDWRIAVGNDSGLDTNSGVITRLTCAGGISNDQCQSWDKVDIVRGLPRSEENHSTNGMALDEGTNTLYVMQGGHANKGAPGNNFSGTPEYYLSAALLSVDLDQIDAMPVYTDPRYNVQFVYDLRTLDDPTRANINNTSPDFPYPSGHPLYNSSIDPGDPFGGNNGLNQAIPEPGGPVQVYSPGFRNAYDVVFTSQGRLYTSDNGPNGGWGGLPLIYDSGGILKGHEGQSGVSFDAGAGDYCTNEFNDDGSSGHGDPLHFVAGPGYYGGHPTPIRAFPEESGIYIYEEISGSWQETAFHTFSSLLPPDLSLSDFPNNPLECDYSANDSNKYIDIINSSTNGITEYTADNFGGAMQGNILTASFNGDINRYVLNAAGDAYTTKEAGFFSGFGSTPLDLVAQGDNDIFGGTIWAATYGSDDITIFEPADYDGQDSTTCTGADDDAIDEDNDGYTNADEIDNGANPCSGGSKPSDHDKSDRGDGFLDSDLNDEDDDDDGILDVNDAFAIDADNGTTTNLPVLYPFWNNDPGAGFFGLGFTGLMSNGATDYLDQYDEESLAAGGATGKMGVEVVTAGDAYQGTNTQENAFQYGVNVDDSTAPFVVHTEVEPPYFAVNGTALNPPEDYQSMGMFIGTGDQDNYLKIVFNANGGNGGVEVLLEDGGSASSMTYGPGTTGDLLNASEVDLYLLVDPAAATAQPYVSIDGGTTVTSLGTAVAIPSAWLSSADNQGLAVGIISTSNGPGVEFSASWDFLNVVPVAASELAVTPASADFGAVQQGDSAVQIFTFSNTGDPLSGDVTINNISVSGADATEFSVNNSGPVTLGPGEIVDVEVTFTAGVTGTKSATLEATHDGDNTSPLTAPLTAESVDAPTVLACYNANGSEYVSTDLGRTFQADAHFSGGSTYAAASSLDILGTNDDVIYRTERYGDFSYSIPVGAAGDYVVELYFAEIYQGVQNGNGAGARLFDAAIEGAQVLDDYDIIVESGAPATAIVESFNTTTSDSNIDITFTTVEDNAKISAICVLEFGGAPTNTPPTLDPIADQFNTEGDNISNIGLTATATDPDTNDTLTYGISGQPSGIDIEPTNGQIYGVIDAGAATNSPYAVTVTVDDGTDTDTETFTWTVYEPTAGGTVLYRVNNGGPELADSPIPWAEDQSTGNAGGSAQTGTPSQYLFLGGNAVDKTFGSTATVTNNTDAPDALFQTERYSDAANPDNMQWDFPVDNGDYEVNLYFAETWSGAASPGVRVFDVEIEDTVVLDDYDPYVAGGNQIDVALKESFQVTITDGNIDIDFIKDAQNPAIKGIEIVQLSASGTPTIEITSPTEGQVFNTDTVVLEWNTTGADDSAGDHVHLYIDHNNYADRISPLPLSGTYTITNLAEGSHFVTLKVADTSHAEYPGAEDTVNFTVDLSGGETPLYRVNVGGPQVAAADSSSPDWSSDTDADPSPYRTAGGPNTFSTNSGSAYSPIDMSDPSLPPSAPVDIFEIERWDPPAAPEMTWAFPVDPGTTVEVRLYFAELFDGITATGDRIFDVSVEGAVPAVFDDIDQYATAGPAGAFMLSHTLTVNDGSLDLVLLHDVENTALKGVEIIETSAPDTNPSALIQVNPGAGLNASTYGNNSFQIENTGDVDIVNVTIDSSTTFMPDVVFDPVGKAGDSGAKCLTEGSASVGDVGITVPADGGSDAADCESVFAQPHNGVDDEEGYDILTLDFTDFNPNELFAFGVDMDPTSIKGDLSTGDAGSISGFELIGAAVTVEFADGQTITANLFDEGSLGGSAAVIAPDAPTPAPSIAADGLPAPTVVSDPNQTIVVSGSPGDNVTLLQVDARLHIDPGNPGVGYDIDPFEANEAMAKVLYTGAIGQNGVVNIPVTLLQTAGVSGAPDGGLNHFIAVVEGTSDQNSETSNVIVLEYDPTANSAPVIDAIADQTIEEGATLALAFNATDADGDALTITTSSTPDASAFFTETVTTDGSGTYTVTLDIAPQVGDAGSYGFTVTADDGATSSNETFNLDVTAAPTSSVLYRVNAGGPQLTSLDSGPDWSVDTDANPSPYHNTGSNTDSFPTDSITDTVPATTPDAVFATERWDDSPTPEMLWTFPVADGDYEVRLYFKSGWNGADTVGDRQFDVEIEGNLALDDYDIVADVGHRVGTMQSFTVTVSDGNLNIDFLHGPMQNPLVNAIEIIDVTAPPANNAPAIDAIADQTVQEGDTLSFSFDITDADGDALSITTSSTPDASGFYTETVTPTGSGAYSVTLEFAPQAGDAGSYDVTVTADDGTEASTEPFTLTVTEPGAPEALIEINPGGGLGASTYSDGSFQVTNNSTGGITIESIELDLSTGILPDMVFDPTGSGGDATSKCLTANSGGATVGFVTPSDPCVDPYSQPRNGGFDVLSLNFDDFDPSEFFTFVTDVDPNSIQGVSGAGNAGAVSGYELIGATVTITFSDGSVITSSLYEDGSLGGSQAIVAPTAPAAPTIDVVGVTTPATVSDPNQTVLVTGAPGANVSLLLMDARLYIASGDPPFDVTDPTYYANEAMSGKTLYTAVIEPDGDVEIPVTLLQTAGASGTPDGGLNHFIAVLSDGPYAVDQQVSQTSNVEIVKYDPTAGIPAAHVEINPGTGLTSSTFNGGFIIENTGDLLIDSVSFDLSTAIYPNMVFDPNGTAGDAAGKCFTPTSGGAATGLIAPSDACSDPFSAPRGNGGYDVITVDFSEFDPGESFEFAVDVDPTSIESASSTGGSGSVSGLELAGSTVTITFSDGSVLTTELYRIPGSNGGSQNDATADPLAAAPDLQIVGLPATPTDAVVADPNQTVEISGAAGADVALLVIESDLLTDNTIADPFEANEAQAVAEYFDAIGAGGTVQIPVTLNDAASGDLYYIVAVIQEPDGRTSSLSQVWRLELDPTAATADLTGSFTMEGRSDYGVDLTVDVYEVGQTTPAYSFTPTATSGGEFTVTGIAPGTYEIAVKHSNTLQVVETLTLAAGGNTADFGELLAGDANDDNLVSALDFSILAGAYNSQVGDANYDARADFNGDGFVTGLDFSLLAGNFNVAGENPSE